jgi:hypothetical protein
MRTLALAVVLGATTPAAAEPWGFGARIGGYGFRDVGGDGHGDWNDCRMNGLGVFGERRFGEHAFAEAALDMYTATGESVMTEHMDRVSTLATVAAGLRMFPNAIVSPFVQVGLGAEHTHVTAGTFDESRVLPVGFIGAGGDLHLGDHLRLGMTLRALVMGAFDHGAPDKDPTLSAKPAAQLQFFARYDL